MSRRPPATATTLFTLATALLLSLSLVFASDLSAAVAPRLTADAKENPRENYDVRDDKRASDVIERYRQKAAKRSDAIRQKKEKIRAAAARVGHEVPGLAIAFSDHTGAPEIVGVARGNRKLTSRSREPRENVARGFLQRNADLYGLTPREVAQLRKIADYANPGGNLAWVEYKQELNGLPLFRGEIRFAITTEGEIVQTTGNLVPALDDLSDDGRKGASVSADAAVVTAAASIGRTFNGSPVVREASPDGTTFVFEPGPFTDDIKVQLEYFPLDGGIVTLAWSMILWENDAAFYAYVSAEGGELLWRKNIVNDQVQPATYVVYDNDSPAPLSPSNATPGSGIQGAIIPRTSFTIVSENTFDSLGWMTDGDSITSGNNVDAGLDLVSPNGIDAGSRATGTAFRVFDYPYNPGPGDPAPGDSPTLADYRKGEVVNMFFWANRYHDRLYDLGFTEQARNFQVNNFGRGGLGNDRILAEGQDFSGTSNANFATPPDGSSGRMQMYIFEGPNPDRTSGLDQEILIHEMTHGTSNRLHNNGSGLDATMSGGMGEGWSDFYARSLTSRPDEDVNGNYAMGGYSTLGIVSGFTDNYYYGIRRFPHAVISSLGPNGKPFNPLTFADIDPTQINLTDGAFPRGPIGSSSAFQVHNIGEVWCSALLEVRARLITRLGWAVGNQLALQLVTDAMKLDPVNPTMLQGRNSILAANFASAAASAETELDIWRGFAARGMGFSASAVSSSSGSVVEAFDMPAVSIGAATLVSDDCDHGGVPDPGETIVLSIPFTNPFLLNAVNDAIVTVGTTTIALGPLAAGETVVETFTIQIPDSASCGSRYEVPVSVTSSFGTTSSPITLQIGMPTAQVPDAGYSSGSAAVPILDQQTAELPIEVTGSGPVGNVKVSVRLNHSFDGDLVISLVAPDGTAVTLANHRGSSGDNFGSGAADCSGTPTVFEDGAPTAISAGTAPFAGSFRPDSPLSAFNGHEMNGTWKLRVSDTANLDTGTLFCAKVELTRQLFYCCGVEGDPLIQAAPPATLASECSSAANGAPDPGEKVTVNFPLKNVGSGLTTNLVATLVDGGGITAISGPQSYGVLSPVGSAVSRPFELVIDGSVTCGADVVATLALTDGPLDLGTVTFNIRTGAIAVGLHEFANSSSILIPATGTGASTGAPAAPYPSTVSVAGVSGTVTRVGVTLHGFSHTFPGDVDVLLVGPGGQKFTAMSDLGGGVDAVNLTIALDDEAAAPLPSTLVSGTFRPGNSGATDAFPAPAPAAPYASPAPGGTATFASVFGGADPNGTWSLYVVDDAGADAGSISGGWTLTIHTADPVCAVVAAPSVSGASATPNALWPPNHKMRSIEVSYDPGSDCAHCTLSVTSSEPDSGTGRDDVPNDWEIVDAHHVRLRAERADTGPGRIYTITVTCFNGAGTSSQSTNVYVAHDIASPMTGASFRVGSPVAFSGRFWDKAGVTHTARWTFDTLSTAGTVVEPNGSRNGTVGGSYTFADAGVYRVTMQLTGSDGSTASVNNFGDLESLVVIYDPNGGYVIGGGWYPSASGKTTFGFNSKYTNAKNPKGEVQLTFDGHQFDANNLEYLAISGARAQVGGFGKLDGDGPYNFILTMVDGQSQGGGGVDRIRMKIWHKVSGKVIYDTQPGQSDAVDPTTPLGSGSIVLQK